MGETTTYVVGAINFTNAVNGWAAESANYDINTIACAAMCGNYLQGLL